MILTKQEAHQWTTGASASRDALLKWWHEELNPEHPRRSQNSLNVVIAWVDDYSTTL